MSKSNVIERIQTNLSNTIDTILNHQYLDALEKNAITKHGTHTDSKS